MRTVLPHNQQLLDFIKQHQPIGSARMFTTFDGAGESQSAFSKRLQYLKDQGWLVSTRSSSRAVWSINDEQRPMHTGPYASADAASPWRKLGSLKLAPCGDGPTRIVPPNTRNIMLGTYQPPPATAQRPGSDDHTRLPSLRQGQRLAFVPGYIHL